MVACDHISTVTCENCRQPFREQFLRGMHGYWYNPRDVVHVPLTNPSVVNVDDLVDRGYVPVPAVVIENRSGFGIDMIDIQEDE